MGNICRSPSAEGYFRHQLSTGSGTAEIGTDSAGTHGYHIGHPPDSRAIAALGARGIDISGLRARRVVEEDFERFDLIIAMDHANLDALKWMQERELPETQRAEIRLMMEFSSRYPEVREVPDPYYGSGRDFEYMCDLLDDATLGLLGHLQQDLPGDGLGQAGD